MSLVLFENETLDYGGVPVLEGINLALCANERVAILGRSGVGKTTLLTAIYQKHALSDQRVALVPQELALVPQLSVIKNALMGRLDDHGMLHNLKNLLRTGASARRDVLAILASLELIQEADRAVEGLSGGQKQRVALARALYRGGDVLIGDEPFSALDEKQGKALIGQVVRRFGTTIFAMHDVRQALDFATRIIGLRQGAIAIDAPAETLSPHDLDALYLA